MKAWRSLEKCYEMIEVTPYPLLTAFTAPSTLNCWKLAMCLGTIKVATMTILGCLGNPSGDDKNGKKDNTNVSVPVHLWEVLPDGDVTVCPRNL